MTVNPPFSRRSRDPFQFNIPSHSPNKLEERKEEERVHVKNHVGLLRLVVVVQSGLAEALDRDLGPWLATQECRRCFVDEMGVPVGRMLVVEVGSCSLRATGRKWDQRSTMSACGARRFDSAGELDVLG